MKTVIHGRSMNSLGPHQDVMCLGLVYQDCFNSGTSKNSPGMGHTRERIAGTRTFGVHIAPRLNVYTSRFSSTARLDSKVGFYLQFEGVETKLFVLKSSLVQLNSSPRVQVCWLPRVWLLGRRSWSAVLFSRFGLLSSQKWFMFDVCLSSAGQCSFM